MQFPIFRTFVFSTVSARELPRINELPRFFEVGAHKHRLGGGYAHVSSVLTTLHSGMSLLYNFRQPSDVSTRFGACPSRREDSQIEHSMQLPSLLDVFDPAHAKQEFGLNARPSGL